MALPRPVRRLLLPVLVALELVLIVVMCALGAIGLVFGLVDRRLRLFRLAIMALAYLSLELTGLAGFFAISLIGLVRGADWSARAERTLLSWVLDTVIGAAGRTVGFRVVIQEPPELTPFGQDSPVLVLARHGGIGDSFALVWILCARYSRRPRVVVSDMLLWDPLIDVALTRMGACWVGRGSGRPGQRAAVARTAAGCRRGEAVLIFPEGGNWTPRRRLRVMAKLWGSGQPEALRAAALMDHVLAPRVTGVLACLETRPDLPVVVMAHTGLDRITSASDVWHSIPFGVPMRLRWWLSAEVPRDEAARAAWLTAEWAVLDEWIDGTVESRAANDS